MIAKPKWKGSVLEFHSERMPKKRQSNSVITEILDLFEAAGWPAEVILPPKIEGDITQALYDFNKKCHLLHLSQYREKKETKVTWTAQIRPRSE